MSKRSWIVNAEKRGFTHGVVYAVALLIRCKHEGAAETLWTESGFSFDDLKVCDDYDANEVRKYFSKFK